MAQMSRARFFFSRLAQPDFDSALAVADSSKLGRVGFTPIAPLSAVHKLVTDADAPPQLIEEIRAEGIQVIIV